MANSTPTPKASRSFIDKVDPTTRQVLTPMFKRIEDVELASADIGTVTKPLTTHLDANSNRLTNVAEAQAGTDAPTFDQVKKYLEAFLKSKGLI